MAEYKKEKIPRVKLKKESWLWAQELRKLDEEWLKKLTEMDKGSWFKLRAHGRQTLTSSVCRSVLKPLLSLKKKNSI